jgi:hypothetical protein
MAVKPENQFISGIHKYLQHDAPYREKTNNPYRGGTPDVWYSGDKADLWIEYKFLPRKPQRGSVTAELTELQKLWLRKRHAEGRRVYVIVGCPLGGVIMRSLEWEQPIPVDEFNERIATRKELSDWIVRETMR